MIDLNEDYDEIDLLIDTDPIRLGERCRRAEHERDAAQHVLAALAFQAGGELRVSEAALTAVPKDATLTSSNDPVDGMYVITAGASREENTEGA